MCRKTIGRVYANISCGFSLDGAVTEDLHFLYRLALVFLHFLQRIVFVISNVKKHYDRASLVAQWLRIRLPMQGTRVRAPVREDPTCRGVARSVSHNY